MLGPQLVGVADGRGGGQEHAVADALSGSWRRETISLFGAGARSDLLKDIPGPEFLAALHRVYGGQRHLPPTVARRLAERTPCAELTAKELVVLQLLGKGFSNREMGEVWCST